MKFVDKEIQEDFDSLSIEYRDRLNYQKEWLIQFGHMILPETPIRPKILFVKEWLERKRKQQKLFNDALEGLNPKPTYGIQFEIINGKLVSNMVKIDKD